MLKYLIRVYSRLCAAGCRWFDWKYSTFIEMTLIT